MKASCRTLQVLRDYQKAIQFLTIYIFDIGLFIDSSVLLGPVCRYWYENAIFGIGLDVRDRSTLAYSTGPEVLVPDCTIVSIDLHVGDSAQILPILQ
jgi:hypothetical protein